MTAVPLAGLDPCQPTSSDSREVCPIGSSGAGVMPQRAASWSVADTSGSMAVGLWIVEEAAKMAQARPMRDPWTL